MKKIESLVRGWIPGVVCVAVISLVAGVPAWAQGEKRTVVAEGDFHWQGSLKAGQTLEVVNRNGEIGASSASGDTARVEGTRKGSDDDRQLFIEVVEYPDSVTICAVYAKDKTPGRCHHGGVSSEPMNWSWRGHRAKINFDVQVPRGERFNAKTTNGGVRVSMGGAKWSGELEVMTTNGNVDVTLPASAEFKEDAATTNGGIHTDFPVTVQGSFSSKALSGTVGGGGRELKVATTNGGIELKKS